MGYSVIKSFERGIDTRRMIDTTEAGALLNAKDCHITRGGEIEKRAAFIVTATLPASTIGLYVTRGPTFHTWGLGATPPAGMPSNAVYHNAQLPDNPDTLTVDESTLGIVAILSVEEFSGKLYVIILYTDDKVRHWYNDELLENPTVARIALVLSRAVVPAPAPFLTIPLPGPIPPTTPVVGMPQAKFFLRTDDEAGALLAVTLNSPGAPAAITESDYVGPGATRIKLIPNMTLWNIYFGYIVPDGGYERSGDPVVFAQQMASLINEQVTVPKVWAIVNVEGRLTVWVDRITDEYNGWKLNPVGFPAPFTANVIGEYMEVVLSGGVDPPDPPVDPTVPPEPGPIDVGTFVLAHNEKLYCTKKHNLYFTALRDPKGWPPAEGGGNIDHTMMGEGAPNLVSLADYGGDLAVFADRHIFIWRMDPDEDLNFKRQVLHRTGTISPHSVVAFGQNEVMYLDRSGIRSLRQRESQDAGFAADLGNNIDDLVTAKIRNTSNTQHERNFWGEVEPTSGRLWMALHDTIYVLSYFPGNRIAAWTYYDASSSPVDMMNATDEHIYWRSGDDVYVYGGETGVDYDDTEAVVRAPYIDAGKPATFKSWNALDAALLGTWQIRASFDPTQPDTFDLLANVTKSTYAQEKIAVNGKSPSLSLELRSTFNGPARIGNAALHYDENFSD